MEAVISEFALTGILLVGIGAFIIFFIICFGAEMDYKEE